MVNGFKVAMGGFKETLVMEKANQKVSKELWVVFVD
jgi:hypothetical protein